MTLWGQDPAEVDGVVWYGVLVPNSMPVNTFVGSPSSDFEFFQLTHDQVSALMQHCPGAPVHIEHEENIKRVGSVVACRYVPGDRAYVWFKFDDSDVGRIGELLVSSGTLSELSLHHVVHGDGRLEVREVSICRKGARRGCHILSRQCKAESDRQNRLGVPSAARCVRASAVYHRMDLVEKMAKDATPPAEAPAETQDEPTDYLEIASAAASQMKDTDPRAADLLKGVSTMAIRFREEKDNLQKRLDAALQDTTAIFTEFMRSRNVPQDDANRIIGAVQEGRPLQAIMTSIMSFSGPQAVGVAASAGMSPSSPPASASASNTPSGSTHKRRRQEDGLERALRYFRSQAGLDKKSRLG